MQSGLPAELGKGNLLAPERRARSAERRLPSPALTPAYTLGGPKCHVCNCSGRIRRVSRGEPGCGFCCPSGEAMPRGHAAC